MKELMFFIMLCFIFANNVYSQSETYSDSKSSSYAMVSGRVPIGKIPVDLYVKKYVEEKIIVWQQKGEFEKSLDYQKRVNETTRNQKIQKFTDEAITAMKKEYINSINWRSLELSTYDADNETYLITSDEFGNFALPVPIAAAQSLKQNWTAVKYQNQDFYISNNKLVLAKLSVVNPATGIRYTYDSKMPTTYAASNVQYNFGEINISVKNENASSGTKIVETKTVVGKADVDVNIPVSNAVKSNTYAIIIGNEDYSSFQTGLNTEVNVDFAVNDATVFKEYVVKTLGVPDKQVKFLKNATAGQMNQALSWISNLAKIENGNAELIFYYSGHGLPDENTREPYLIPVDVSGKDLQYAISLNHVYSKLNEYPAKKVTVFLDACFSGGARNKGLLAVKGIKLVPKEEKLTGNMIVFASSSGEESSAVYREKQHGYFTYFLLKKIQETNGAVSFKNLSDYLIQSVQKETGLSGKIQTPNVSVSPAIQYGWESWKLK